MTSEKRIGVTVHALCRDNWEVWRGEISEISRQGVEFETEPGMRISDSLAFSHVRGGASYPVLVSGARPSFLQQISSTSSLPNLV
jgi:hypothetical protein